MLPVLAALALAIRPAVAGGWDAPLALRACPAQVRELPRDMDAVLAAVVTVEAAEGTGAGFLASPDGFVLTAAHVVRGTGPVTVRRVDGASAAAERIRVDPAHDVALLRIPGSGHPCLAPPPEPPPIGAEVYAIGAPGGVALSHSVSKGIVSARREWEAHRFLQTDAALSPGNSGGPLVGIDGSVLGIVSWKVSGQGVEGLSFGIPVESASAFLALAWGPVTDLSAWRADRVLAEGGDPPLIPSRPATREPRVLESGSLPAPPPRSRRVLAPLVTCGAGGALILGSWATARAAAPISLPAWRAAQAVNTMGWVALGTGGLWWVAVVAGRPALRVEF